MDRRAFLGFAAAPAAAFARKVRVATFDADVTPPLASPLCIGLVEPARTIDDPLKARGVVILAEGQRPIVLCSVDWLGIGNGGYDRWRGAMARAAGTEPSRVALHTVHQHDAPGDDASAQELLTPRGLAAAMQNEVFTRAAIARVAGAIRKAKPVPVTHIGAGSARVDRVASNRRIVSPEGKFLFQRYTACRGSAYCAEPEGVIDPELKSISFLNSGRRVATLSYYATHPMSHYGKGAVSSDFPGIARSRQQDTFPIYFTGAAGNIGAGKYNDGSPEARGLLAERLAAAMTQARSNEGIHPIDSIRWNIAPVALPLRSGKGFDEADALAVLDDPASEPRFRANHARYLAWIRLCRAGRRIDVAALNCGPVHIIHMPGELFVEYQLAAIHERRNETVAMAAYGDYGPMYIGTAKAYREGGYETSAVSRVSPAVEDLLLSAVRRVF